MGITIISEQKCFEGTQGIYSHDAVQTHSPMRFAVFTPHQAKKNKLPVLYWLSGLTCTEENFITKAGAQRIAAECGLMIVVPDTSPRNLDLAGEADSYDFGVGAGFYLDATQSPWDKSYRMYSYISKELIFLIENEFHADSNRMGIFGHSMGGHGALTIALKNPNIFKSVSAFAPICSPMRCPWGEKAFSGYLGQDKSSWQEYDATVLIKERGWKGPALFIDQGTQDPFIETQLKPQLLLDACQKADIPITLRMQEGYDHSYYFIASFIEDHLRFHAKNL